MAFNFVLPRQCVPADFVGFYSSHPMQLEQNAAVGPIPSESNQEQDDRLGNIYDWNGKSLSHRTLYILTSHVQIGMTHRASNNDGFSSSRRGVFQYFSAQVSDNVGAGQLTGSLRSIRSSFPNRAVSLRSVSLVHPFVKDPLTSLLERHSEDGQAGSRNNTLLCGKKSLG